MRSADKIKSCPTGLIKITNMYNRNYKKTTLDMPESIRDILYKISK